MNTKTKLEAIRENGYELNFGAVLEGVIDNYKKIALIAGAIILVLMLVFFMIWFGLIAVFYTAGNFADTVANFEKQNLTTLGVVINLMIGVISAALLAPVTAGLLKIADDAQNHRELSFSTGFEFYRHPAFKDIFTAALLTNFTAQAISMIFQLMGQSLDNQATGGVFTLIGTLISLLINLLTFLVVPLIIFGKLNATDAIKASLALVLKKFWTILLLVVVCLVCSLLGLVAFCVGIFFTFPIMNALQYVVYREAIGIDEGSELDQIGESPNEY